MLLCIVLAAAAAYWFSERQTKQYTATASLAFSYNQLGQQVSGLQTAGSNESQQVQENTNVKLVQLGDVAARTATRIGNGLTAEQVKADLSVTPQGESSVVSVAATASSPTVAAAIANVYSRRFVTEQQNTYHKYYSSALALVNKQLAALTPRQRTGAAGLALENRAQSLGVLAELQSGTVQIAQAAAVPTAPSSPKVSRNTVLGAALGLLVGLVLALLLERFDGRIREPEDLSAIYRLPLLGVVPQSKGIARASKRRKQHNRALLPPREAEVFHLIRAHLRYFNVDRELRTLLVTSAAPGDGKTTVARHLAVAAATMGSTVLLLEADLRRPNIADQLDIASGPGISDVLIGSISLWRATQPVALDPPPGGVTHPLELDVLVAGAVPPPNPAELLESDSMAGVIQQARETYDLVVIDTSPLDVVSDAFPLLRGVDGVVVVGWVGRNRRAVAERLRDTLESAGAPLLGVIANGAKAVRLGSYSYDDGYSNPQVGDESSLSHVQAYTQAGANGSAAASPNGNGASRPLGRTPSTKI